MNQVYLEHVKEAKESLRIWIANVEQMHNGIQMFSKENDLDRNNTDFAKWYYGEGQTFTSFETYKSLEPFYDEMYDLFIEYMNLRDTPIKKGFFSNHADKRKTELAALFVNLRKAARKLIKSVDIFEEKLVKSPLFDSAIELDNTALNSSLKNVETETFEPVIEDPKNKETQVKESLDMEFSENINDDSKPESKTEQTENIDLDFEKRLQEEVAKLKKKLEAEFKKDIAEEEPKEQKLVEDSIKEMPQKQTSDTSEKENAVSKEAFPKTKSEPNNDSDIDLDEEIRRILS